MQTTNLSVSIERSSLSGGRRVLFCGYIVTFCVDGPKQSVQRGLNDKHLVYYAKETLLQGSKKFYELMEWRDPAHTVLLVLFSCPACACRVFAVTF